MDRKNVTQSKGHQGAFFLLEEKKYLQCKNPLKILTQWCEEASRLSLKHPEAMILSTSSLRGKVTSRVVLLKEILKEGLLFYSNYQSLKGKNILENPWGSILFYWDAFHRQVRINGKIQKTSRRKSKDYWEKRPRTSQISQWVSSQSKVLKDRHTLEKEYLKAESQFKGKKIPCPQNWGGYVLKPQSIEFWIFKPRRLHDRFYYEKKRGLWNCKRLYP